MIKVIYKVLPSAAFFGTVKFFSYMIILDNSKNSVPSIQIVMEFHSNPLQDLRHEYLKEIYSQLLLNFWVWNKVHLDDHLGFLIWQMKWLFQRDLISSSSCCNTLKKQKRKHCSCKFKLTSTGPLTTMSLKKVIHQDVILLNDWDHQDSTRWFCCWVTINETFVFTLAIGMISTQKSLHSVYNYIFSPMVPSDKMWNEFQLLDTA